MRLAIRIKSTQLRAFCCTLAALGLVCGARPLASATTSAVAINRMAAMALTAYGGRMSTAGRRSSLDLGPESVRSAGRAPCVQARADASSAAVTRALSCLDARFVVGASGSKTLAARDLKQQFGAQRSKMRAALALLPVVGAYVPSIAPKRAVAAAVSKLRA